jgi:predicted Zn-dependent peptidase
MRALTHDHPPEQAELDRMAITAANRNAARLEVDADVLEAMADAVSDGLPYDDLVRQPARLRALTIDQVERAAAAFAKPDTVHWVVVGDWPQIRDQFKALNIGEPVVIDMPR